MTTILQVNAATVTFADGEGTLVALDDCDLTLEAGELALVMGPSGSGKSTLLAVAGGLAPPTTGTVAIAGRELKHGAAERARRLREDVGYVYQRRNLLADLSAIENVALPLELAGMAARAARSAAADALAAVGLTTRADMRPAQLSGGEEQRVAVARALIGSRRLLLADEPTGAVDSIAAQALMGLIRARCDAGAAALVATHDATLAAFADRVIFLRDGAVVGATAEARA